MVAMIEARTGRPDEGPLTVEELDLLPDDGYRYEIDDGLLTVSPSPVAGHQLVVMLLSGALHAACPPEYQVLPGLGVALSPIQYRIPDVVVINAGTVEFDKPWTAKPPVLAVEVASPSTAAYDRSRKKDVYASFGVASYWIVKPDLEKPSITEFRLRRGRYLEVAQVHGDEVFRPTSPFPCEIIPAGLVAGPWQR
jgi:Uma2 family endonuclease